MPTSLVSSDSLLAIDVGTVNTRAILFDIVEGRYRFLAMGTSATSTGAPYNNIAEGVHNAIENLQTTTGRIFFGSDGQLILPTRSDGSGIDKIVATLSIGKPLKIVAVGLLDDISTESAVRLATTTYGQVVEKISIIDKRNSAARLDSILKVRPDLIIVAGGTESGASHSVMNMLESVGLACYLLPESNRPEVLYAGNSALAEEVKSTIGPITRLSVAPNIRPSIDIEQLAPAQKEMAVLFRSIRSKSFNGVHDLNDWAAGHLIPTSMAFGRVIRFLSKVYDPVKGVLGVDVGASATTIAAAFDGEPLLGVYPDLGLGPGLTNMLRQTSLEDITRWIGEDISEPQVRDYIYNKTLHPRQIPVTVEEMAVEEALARRALQIGINRLSGRFPAKASTSGHGLLPWFEPVLASGSVLTNAPNLGHALLTLLDGLQPTGVTTIVLDQNNIASSLGAVAEINSILPVQILESNTFLNLGTVISPVGTTQFGSPALRMKVTVAGGSETSMEVKYGNIEVIQLPLGQTATLQLQPVNRFDVGLGGPGRGGSVKVSGGALGVIIDARGRPIRLPAETARRREYLKKWQWLFGN